MRKRSRERRMQQCAWHTVVKARDIATLYATAQQAHFRHLLVHDAVADV